MKNIVKLLCIIFTLNACQSSAQTKALSLTPSKGKAMAYFAEGCFWCSEHIFEAIPGVDDAISGYAGGNTKNPTYKEVCSETTGHAEAIAVIYDPNMVTYAELVKVFFASHNPTTPDQQGPDRGSSYRSVAFYQNDDEKKAIDSEILAVNASGKYKNKVVTEVLPLSKFYKAEDYHQNYIEHNPDNPYVQGVSLPRFELFKKTYKGKLKANK